MIDAIIFDLDGTLADTIRDLATACNYALKRANLPLKTLPEYVKIIGHGRKQLLIDSAGPEYGEAHIDELIADFNEYYSEHFCDETVPYDGMKEVVEELKKQGYKLGILSNKPHEMTVPIMDKLYGGLFDFVMGQMKGMPVKPDRKTIDYIAEKLGVTSDNTVVIGDSEVDIQTAKNAGAKSVAVTWGYRSAETLRGTNPDFIAEEPQDILKAMEQL